MTLLQNLTATTAPATTDLVYTVVDPSGTPLSRKMTIASLFNSTGYTGTMTLLATPTTVNAFGAATTIAIGAAGVGSKTTINSAQILAGDGTALLPVYSFASDPDTGLFRRAATEVNIVIDGVERNRFASGNVRNLGAVIARDGFGFFTGDISAAIDLILERDAANTLALRNGVNAQTFNWYATYTDASNYEGGYLTAAAGSVTIGARTLGTGTDGIAILIKAAGTSSVQIHTNGNERWGVDSSGILYAGVDNGYDIGTSSSNRPRTAYLGTSLVSPTIYGDTAANGDITIEGTSSATKTTSYVILQPTGGNVGIGTTTPLNKTVVIGVAADPDTSGSSSNGIFRIGGDGVFRIVDIGLSGGSPIYTWIQSRDSSNYTQSYSLVLQPNGGNVIIGATAAGTTAAKTLALTNSATDPTASADLAHLYAHDISAGNACLALYQETANITTVDNAANRKIPMWVNGVQLYVLATTSNA